MTEKISIIVPIYNKEKYLTKCVESLISQTYDNIEILLIDDGSTDNSKEMCKQFEKKDSRISYFYKKNGGVSSARNFGISKSSGDRIVFVDADDYVDVNYIKELSSYKEDFIICSYYTVNNNDITKDDAFNETYEQSSCKEMFLHPKFRRLIATPYIKLYKRDIIKKNNIKFDEKISYGEDTCFNIDYVKHINSLRIINYRGYYNVIEGKGTLSRKYIKNIREQLNFIIMKIEELKVNDDSLYYWYFRNLKTIIYNEKTQKYKIFKSKIKEIKTEEKFKNIRNHKNLLSVFDRLVYILMQFNLYWILYIIYKIK